MLILGFIISSSVSGRRNCARAFSGSRDDPLRKFGAAWELETQGRRFMQPVYEHEP
jgi:hypothetical protein